MGEASYRAGFYPDAQKTFTDLHNAAALDGDAEGRLLPYNIGYSYVKAGDYANALK